MTKNTAKKTIGKKNLKEEKKTSKLATVVKAVTKLKEIQVATKESKPSKGVKIAPLAKNVKAEKHERAAKKEIEVAPSLQTKITGKIIKPESKQKEAKILDSEIKTKESKAIAKIKDVRAKELEATSKLKGPVVAAKTQEVKKIKEPKVIREEAVQVNVVDIPEKPKKQTKKAQAAYQTATEEEAKWLELKDKYKAIHPSPYKMSEIYQEKTLLDHKVLGLGVILSVVNDRLEVLFQTGTKHLISNYKK